MKKIILILLILCLLIFGAIACTKTIERPVAGLYTPRETIDVVSFTDISENWGSDAVRYYEIKLQITNISNKDIYISDENFECSVDSEVVPFFYNDEELPNAMVPFSLKPNATTTEYLYIKVPIDAQYVRFCMFTEYDCGYFILKTP